ncbi:hypothetical protein [Oryzihumus leptocrescens]|uniref:Uncharacterized protein n=1 Tax=Oryzihumus leptocrescens TaxID=297536 RepID=A0A542ZH63_9MICO|nr:hypothetical protein [Oryzihumus leptocrescens]TQL59693.1 hypothetical protein FB474_1059 [Oryzihumus leptocrescens]
MTRLLFDGVVHTDYGQLDLLWGLGVGFDGDFDRWFAGQVNGLVGAASGDGLYINLARRSGGSPVRIALEAEAPGPPSDQWEDVVEVSVTVPPGGEARWCTWANETRGTLDLPPGPYRVRVSARGRDAGRAGELADGSVDAYLIQLWEAPDEVDAVVRSTSANGAYWHREVGSRR